VSYRNGQQPGQNRGHFLITIDDAGTILGGVGEINVIPAGSVTISATSGIATIDVTGGGAAETLAQTLALGSLSGGTDINMSAGDSVRGVAELDLQAAGAITIGTDAVAQTITMGNATGATAVNIDAGTGGIAIEAAATVAITTTDEATAATPGPKISMQPGAGGTTGPGGNWSATGGTGGASDGTGGAVSVTGGEGGGTQGDGGSANLEGGAASSVDDNDGTINIGALDQNGPINIGTGAMDRTITVGNTTGVTAVSIAVGSGGLTLDYALFPATDSAGVLTSDGAGALTWETASPARANLQYGADMDGLGRFAIVGGTGEQPDVASGTIPASSVPSPIASTTGILGWHTTAGDATTVFKIHAAGLVVGTATMTAALFGNSAPITWSTAITAGQLLAIECDAGTLPEQTSFSLHLIG
jgi:hypothetical protein